MKPFLLAPSLLISNLQSAEPLPQRQPLAGRRGKDLPPLVALWNQLHPN